MSLGLSIGADGANSLATGGLSQISGLVTGGGSPGGIPGTESLAGQLSEGGHSLKDGIQQITSRTKGTFDEVKGRAEQLMTTNGVDSTLHAAKSIAADPDRSNLETVKATFAGLRSMAGEGLQSMVGDAAGAMPRIDSMFENFSSQALGKGMPGISAMQAAEKAKQTGAV